MKKQQKLHHHHHHQPSRKSPRLSSSAAAASPSTRLSREPEARPGDAWALSLHVAEQQQPVSICYPVNVEDNSVRRSTRFTSNKYKTPPPEKSRGGRSRSRKHTALVLSQLSSSPVILSASWAPALTLAESGNVGSGEAGPKKKRRLSEKAAAEPAGRGCLSERSLRSRAVVMHVGGGGDFSSSERRLRSRVVRHAVAEPPPPEERAGRSERRERGKAVAENCALIELPEDDVLLRKEGEIPQIGMITLPEKSPISSEKCLRSRTVKMQLQVERKERVASVKNASGVKLNKKSLVTPKKESSLCVSSEYKNKEECDMEGMSEKQLRSRKIQSKLDVDENAVTVSDRIGGGCNGESVMKSEKNEKSILCCFVGEAIPEEEARERWQWRYDLKSRKRGKKWKINADGEDEVIWNVESHYAQAKVGNFVLNIGDCVFVKGEGNKKHIGRILEFFKTTEGEDYFRVQWFFRAEDTVLKDAASSHDKRRIFYSTLMNDNPLDCIISKLKIVKVPPMLCSKRSYVQSAAFYYDMEYSVEYSTFRTFVTETSSESQSFVSNSNHPDDEPLTLTPLEILPNDDSSKQELALLDLYSGCGGMSTGLGLGAKLSSVNLTTKWAVDSNGAACQSLKLNHPETYVRNESADDFLDLLKQWEKLCKTYVSDIERALKCEVEELPEEEDCPTPPSESTEEYEVSRLVDICYGDPTERGKRGLHFKVHAIR